MARKIAVYVESGEKRVFASALDWPGWCRTAKSEAEALEKLAEYGSRYAPVAKAAGLTFPQKVATSDFEVVERLNGNATTDFGAPSAISNADSKAYTASGAKPMIDLLEASWSYLDTAVAKAPASLRKGPRGGGRDRDKVFDHVLGAEFDAYAGKIGVKAKVIKDTAGIKAGRKAIVEALAQPYDGKPEERRWPPAFMARRTAWHALDHAWEIEDRSD